MTFIGDLLSDKKVSIEIDTPLIRSGLLDSFALLQLAEWISDHSSAPIDLTEMDVEANWDRIIDIERFIERH